MPRHFSLLGAGGLVSELAKLWIYGDLLAGPYIDCHKHGVLCELPFQNLKITAFNSQTNT
jgi:hypothetical protein